MTTENQNDDRSLHVQGNVDRSVIVFGDGNTVTYTTNVFRTFDVDQFPVRPSQQLSKEEYRWRQVLVQNVKHYWIEGVLERSLHNQALIELGVEERSQAVASPISGVEEFEQEVDQPFPEGTQATDIFDNLGAGRTLLILGEPGAGKTTTLLKLAQTLLTRIGDDFSQPIPVILNLSSWAKKRKSIAEWLVQDLYETFHVSKALGTTWIREGQLTLCLDGLDEVAAQNRNACLQALNYFLQTHGRTEVVVCSRVRDYEALSERLRVRRAIYVQPLTPQQIDRYLEQAGEQLSGLSAVFSRNPEIASFADSPLILSVMSLAYQGYSLDEFPEVGSAQSFRESLFDTYIERMFLRRGNTHRCTDQEAKHWLVWMAQQMIRTSQTVFFIERIQPSWLQSWPAQRIYRFGSALIIGLFIGLSRGLIIIGLSRELVIGLNDGLTIGFIVGLISVFLGDIEPVETLKWPWREIKKILYAGLIYGSMYGLMVGIITGPIYGLMTGSIIWVLAGPFAGPFAGLCAGLIASLLLVWSSMPIVILIGGLGGPGMQKKTKPNQGIWQSARNASILALIYGPILGLLYDLMGGTDSYEQPVGGLIIGLLAALFAWLTTGGSACLRHFSLRLMLYYMGHAPWNYARFLDYATERLFLQKVGGGYIFIHRMLLEHFAQMTLEQKRSK